MSKGAIRTYVPVNQMDKVTSNILNDLLHSDKTDKEIANSNKVELAIVKRVKTRFNKEILEEKEKIKQEDTIVVNMNEKRSIVPQVLSKNNKSKKLSDNDILEILSLITDSTLTYTKIAEKFNVSSKRIQQLAAEYDVQRKPKRKKSENKNDDKKVKVEKKSSDNNKSKLVKVDKCIVEAGLIIDRHPMPVNKYIFKDDIDSELMFNYESMENIVDKFISDNITFNKNGESNEILIVYVSGLQCALSSLFKVCHNRKVNLNIMHYNTQTQKYVQQEVLSYGNVDINNKFAYISKDVKEMYLYNDCTYENILNNTFYALYMYCNNTIKKNLVLFKNFEDIWDVYSDYVKYINDNTNDRLHLILTSAVLEDNRIKWTNVISKSYNYTDYK